MSIAEDLEFAAADIGVEFKNVSSMLRYVAAINTDATRKEFVAACVEAGYRGNSAANRFNESRAFDLANYGGTMDKEGRYSEG